MKIRSGVFTVLLLATTVAMGQQHASYAEPFPQSANPALTNSTAEVSAENTAMPVSMAMSQGGAYTDRRSGVDLGSPFPQAANPALANGSTGETISIGHSTQGGGSPFPSAANPSNSW